MNVATAKETRGFETEVKQLLHLMIHALYSNKEIFLRELISNASDAIDKLRFAAISNSELFEGDTELAIHVSYDKDANTITVRDNGIGMSREDTISHLGTIAKSGTQAFLQSLTGDQAKDRNLIGQFGVGFYSSFIVADKVTVKTRKAGLPPEEGVCWESAGEGDYTVENIELPERGTQIILHLKPAEDEFLSGLRLRNIVGKYSDHINVPVYMKKEPYSHWAEGKEVPEDTTEQEVVNRATALWVTPKSEIDNEAYCEFYKHIAHDFEDPMLWAHNKVEGKFEYTTLLYIPSKAPYDLWQPNKPRGLKLYVRRVFIMDDAEQFLPSYLRFVRGIIDSNDLPLNISREILQSNKLVDAIRASVIKRVLGMLADLAKSDNEKYLKFWREFGQVLKEGPAEDFVNKEAIAKLLRFSSTHNDNETQEISLDDYLSRMKPEQEKIYYIAADSFNAAKNSPHLEIFRAKGVEVLLLSDRIDEWLMSHLTEYEKKQFHSVAAGKLENLDFVKSEHEKESEADKEKKSADEATFKDLLIKVKAALGDKVTEVRLSERLTTSPSCIVSDEGQMSSHMQRILRQAGQAVNNQPTLELNPHHLLVLRLKDEQDVSRFHDLSEILLDQAILAEGGQLDDPGTFVKRFNELLLNVAHKGNGNSTN
ncbi:molecular chaperone HtpG [Candidatus Berkiella aquae]|uniref:Chaperone protein HtpG n=1 Tax=Candidatus Berkiella aquae TaxID=295108 RepID=A0A0Q9YIE3_9GAMM|nr:molecular chaperone HtpG [Candidatus Berkiella aquae]MCS5712281.1 molecular chaperone HtpG [Candidatus Berkiella aquae]